MNSERKNKLNIEDIERSLNNEYNKALPIEQKRKIVFWYDGEKKFEDIIKEIHIENVKVIIMNNNEFYIKKVLEREDKESNYLIYSPNFKPTPEENNLLDILMCNVEFSPNATSLLMKELGIPEEYRDIVNKYDKFFNNNKRISAFQKLGITEYSEEQINLGIIASLIGCENVTLEECLKVLIMDMDSGKKLEQIEKFGDLQTLCLYIDNEYGVEINDKGIIIESFKTLVFTHLTSTISISKLDKYKKYISSKKTNCYVLLNHIMNDCELSVYYNQYIDEIEKDSEFYKVIDRLDTEELKNSYTFRIFDKIHIKKLLNNLNTDLNTFAEFIDLIETRRNLHFYNEYKNEYESLFWATRLFVYYQEMSKIIKSKKAFEMIEIYAKELFVIDTCYRKFYFYYDKIQEKDNFAELKEKVENLYVNGFLNKLTLAWSETVEAELTEEYKIAGITRQDNFFEHYLKDNYYKDVRSIVIISDAFRYECAKELAQRLNTNINGIISVEYMQGLVPSYTKLGMASLLPHTDLKFADNKEDVLIGDLKTTGTKDRENVLNTMLNGNALAIQYSDLYNMKKANWKNIFAGQKVVYIYHNVIDSVGDHSSTEDNVFDAVETTINEIQNLISDLVKTISAVNILVTADHGFLYRRAKIDKMDKISRDDTNEVQKTRYGLSKEKSNSDGIISISLDYLLGKDSGFVNVPRGSIIYSKQGTGVNYAHGGVMPQEIVIPVVLFKATKGKNEISKVGIQYVGISSKITNPIVHLDFLQTDKVEEKCSQLMLKAYFIDESGMKISNENIIIANSSSDNIEERRYKEKFVLRNLKYDRTKNYYLVLEDDETQEEIERIRFIIDISQKYEFDL